MTFWGKQGCWERRFLKTCRGAGGGGGGGQKTPGIFNTHIALVEAELPVHHVSLFFNFIQKCHLFFLKITCMCTLYFTRDAGFPQHLAAFNPTPSGLLYSGAEKGGQGRLMEPSELVLVRYRRRRRPPYTQR